MKKNIFLTGAPSAGKTTVIKKVLAQIGMPCNGFYTEEVRIEGKRTGFLMKTADAREAYLAHKDIQSDFRIRRFGVSIKNINEIAVPSIRPVIGSIIILDEIGKMECFSDEFRLAAVNALNSGNIVMGTIALGGNEFIMEIKKRKDIEIYEVTPGNRDGLPELLITEIKGLINLKNGR